MPFKYDQLSQSYQQLRLEFSNHKLEVSHLLDYFLQSLQNYLGCSENKIRLVNQNGQLVDEVKDAAFLIKNVQPWVLWFVIEFGGNIEPFTFPRIAGKYGIRVNAWREERGWNLKVEGFEQNFLILVNEQKPALPISLDSFNELNEFIYDRIKIDLESYFDRFINYGREVENEKHFGFTIIPLENKEES